MSISRILIILIINLIGLSKSQAQGFLRNFAPDSSMARKVLQTADGGYFMAGRVANSEFFYKKLFLLRTDASGQTVWENHLYLNEARAISACPSADGGFIVLAENYWDTIEYRNVVLKLDGNGALQWTQIIPNGVIANGLVDIIAVSDGNYMAVGTSRDASFNTRNWLVKIAPDGNILWQKVFGATGKIVKHLTELPTGGIVVSGHLADFYLAKVNLNGDLLWEKNYPEPGNQTNYDLLVTADGNLALLGTSPDPSVGALDICVLKTDLDGNKLWLKNYYPFPQPFATPYLPVLNKFVQDGAGNFYIPFWGFLDDPSASNLELLKLSPGGDVLWKHDFEVLGNAWDIIKTADNHIVITGDNNGEPTNAMILKTDFEGEFLSNKIVGNVYRDDDVDCAFTPGEPGLANFIVKAENALGEAYYKNTQPDGSYEIRVTAGDFTLTARPAFAPLSFYAPCSAPTVNVTGTSITVAAPDVLLEEVVASCPLLSVEVSGGLLRRCMPVYYSVSWCNSGNFVAENTQLKVLKHPYLNYQNSSWPLSSQSGDTLFFDLGAVIPGDCGSTGIQFTLDCAASVNDVICVETFISPDNACLPPNANWDGSEIEVTGLCNGSEIEFKIKNTGAGNMTQAAEYVIIEDEIMYTQSLVQLNSGQEMTAIRTLLPEDSCVALQVFPNQTSILSRPVAVVANCNANGNLNLLLSLPNNENDPVVAIHCDGVIGSFDPNDKVGFPHGLGAEHYLERGQDLEYRIRFQNTGNDTAFFVTIRDLLPATLDPSTVRPIAASHPYTWELTDGGVLSFHFLNILLPDSTTNEPASHGFVTFKISQKPNLPDGTLIENGASIYFDFNDPIQTNTWRHTIGRPSVVSTQNIDNQNFVKVTIVPNPAKDQALFALENHVPNTDLLFSLIDPLGKTVHQAGFTGNSYQLNRQKLPAGIYFYQIASRGNILSRGRVVLE